MPQVIFIDCDNFFWAMENGVYKQQDGLYEQALEIYHKARNIKLPGSEQQDNIYVYHTTLVNGISKFESIENFHAAEFGVMTGFPIYTIGVIDLSIPRAICPYDKAGYKRLMKTIKRLFLKNGEIRMSKRLCEEFFENDNNFRLDGRGSSWPAGEQEINNGRQK